MATIRQVVKARDIQLFFGKKERQSFRMMEQMRAHFNKKPFQPITIDDFCEFYNVNSEGLIQAMTASDEFEYQNSAKRKTKNKVGVQNAERATEPNQNPTPKRPLKPTTAYIFSK